MISTISVFTHGNTHPRNDVVDGDIAQDSGVRATGLVNFGSAEFYSDDCGFSKIMAFDIKRAECMEVMDSLEDETKIVGYFGHVKWKAMLFQRLDRPKNPGPLCTRDRQIIIPEYDDLLRQLILLFYRDVFLLLLKL